MILSVDDLIDLAYEGWEFDIDEGSRNLDKGLCCYDLLRIILYPFNCTDELDYHATIAHELIHAVHSNILELIVEHQGILIAETYPELITLTKEMWELPHYKDLLLSGIM